MENKKINKKSEIIKKANKEMFALRDWYQSMMLRGALSNEYCNTLIRELKQEIAEKYGIDKNELEPLY